MYSVSLTNPSSGGFMITVITTDETATGKLCVRTYSMDMYNMIV